MHSMASAEINTLLQHPRLCNIQYTRTFVITYTSITVHRAEQCILPFDFDTSHKNNRPWHLLTLTPVIKNRQHPFLHPQCECRSYSTGTRLPKLHSTQHKLQHIPHRVQLKAWPNLAPTHASIHKQLPVLACLQHCGIPAFTQQIVGRPVIIFASIYQ